MRPLNLLIAVGLLCCGCQGTGPTKYDNPVVGPPPPRLTENQIQRKKMLAAEQRAARQAESAETRTASSSVDGDSTQDAAVDSGEQPIQQASARRNLTSAAQNPDEDQELSSGLVQVALPINPGDPVAHFEDGTIVATVNDQPIFAGEILSPAIQALEAKEQELRKHFGKDYKPEMIDRAKVHLVFQSLPRAVERKMVVLAAKSGLKKQQQEGLKKALEGQWKEHLQEMMDENNVASVAELEKLFKKNRFNLEDHKASFDESRTSQMYVGMKVHSKYEPSRKEMINYYEEHKEEYKTVAKVRWQQLVISFEDNKGPEGAKAKMDKVVEELLAGADFTATIKKYGNGPRAKDGGNWEWTERGTLKHKQVEDELFTLPVGDMSGVMETSDSYQIVLIHERTTDTYTPFEELQEKIKQQMEFAVMNEKRMALLEEIRAASIVQTCFDDWEQKRKAIEAK